jgi:FtsH-binding integral membrane protein
MSYDLQYPYAASAGQKARAIFIRRTYAHLAGAVLAFVGLEALLLKAAEQHELAVLQFMLGGRAGWLIVLLAFMGAGWLARVWANSQTSRALQYMGLGLYVAAQAVIFLPLMIVASHFMPDQHLISTAGILTLAVFGGLTLAVFTTRKDFSYLRPVLCVGGMIALGVIVAACLFGINLGLFFCFAMVALASGFILYDTSNVLHHYPTEQYVGAALELFASVALLFWYILQILMMLNRRN